MSSGGVSFKLSGLETAGLCQKDPGTLASEVEKWNSRHASDKGDIDVTIELAANHYNRDITTGCSKRILLLIEPTVTWPKNVEANFREYSAVYAANSSKPGVRCVAWFNTPRLGGVAQIELVSRLPKFTLLAADKLSMIPGELYSLRRSIADRQQHRVEVFGSSWDNRFFSRLRTVIAEFTIALTSDAQPKFSHLSSYLFSRISSMGPIEEKQSAYNRNRYALVIENSMELRTEKLYDALEAGSIPLYVGPDCDDGIPQELFVSAMPTVKAIEAAMEQISKVDMEEWELTRLHWLKTSSYKTSAEQRFSDFLARASRDIQN